MCQHCPGNPSDWQGDGGVREAQLIQQWPPCSKTPVLASLENYFIALSSMFSSTTRLNELSLYFLAAPLCFQALALCFFAAGLVFQQYPCTWRLLQCSRVRWAGSLLFAGIRAVKFSVLTHTPPLFFQWHEESWCYSGGPSKEDCQQYQSSRNSYKEQPCSCVRYQNDVAQERKTKKEQSCIAGEKWWLTNGRI